MKKIRLTKGHSTLVDDEDYDRLNEFKWHAVETVTGSKIHVCARRWLGGTSPRKCISMAADVLEIYGELIDHINRNPLDNRKKNLRVADKSLNAFNSDRSTNAKGIYFDKTRGRYRVFVLQPVKRYIGMAKTEQEALLLRAKED